MQTIRKRNRFAARAERARAIGRKRAAARWRHWQLSPPDADTLRARAFSIARGRIERAGSTFFGDGRVVPWSVRRSLRGRPTQIDVVVAGRIWRTCGPRRLPAELRPDFAGGWAAE